MKKHKKGKEVTAARHEAKIKRREKRKIKFNAALISKIKPLLIRMEQMKAQLKFTQKEEVNEQPGSQD